MKVAQLCPILCDPMDYTVLGILQARILEWVFQYFPSSGDLPNPRIEPRPSILQVYSLPPEPQRKPNTGVGSLSFLQQIFPTQESNHGLLRCRWILYQLSYQGNSLQKEREKKLMIGKSSPHIKRKYLWQHQKLSKGLGFLSILIGIIAQCNISNS